MKIIELFEPKLPPINLHVISPAYWFYRNKLSRKALIRSIASSTALSTGQRIADLEERLQRHNGRWEGLKLYEENS